MKEVVMTGTVLWIVIAIVVVVIIVAVVLLLLRRGRVVARANQHRAEKIRQDARNDELATREREAEALRVRADADRAKADAQKAQVEAERLARTGADKQSEAQKMRSDVDGRLRRADELDPNVDTDRRQQ
jgi:flagellar biosynthesis/type III secretory pathway M-ring protein FliF/YscJ